MDRREFLETSTVLAGGALLTGLPSETPAARADRQPAPPMIGIQVGAVSFVDEGTDKVLDALQEMAGIIPWFEDVIAADVPGFDRAREVVLTGPPSTFACSRNPNTRNFWLGLVEDYLRSYDVDGLMWGSERQGPLGNVLGTNHGGAGAGGRVACFCEYCVAAGKADGINVDRARQGYSE